MKCLARQTPFGTGMGPQQQALLQTDHKDGAASSNALSATPFESVRENGPWNVRERAVGCLSGSEGEATTGQPQTKEERRKTQKRLWAAEKRESEKQNQVQLQARNKHIVARRKRLRSDIVKLNANARYYSSLLNTLREMSVIKSNQPHPQPSPSSSFSPPLQSTPAAGRALMGAAMSTFTMPPPSTSDVNDPPSMLPNPEVTSTVAMETAAVEDMESFGVTTVLAVNSADMRWNQIPRVADLRGPLQLRIPLSPQSQNAECETSPTPQLLPSVPSDDPASMLPNSEVTPTVTMETAAVGQDVESTGAMTVLAVSSVDMRWNQIPRVADLRGPLQLRIPLSPQSQNSEGETSLGLGPQPLPSVSIDDLMAQEGEEDLLHWLAGFIQSPSKSTLDASSMENMFLDGLMLRSPIPTKEGLGIPEFSPQPCTPASAEMDPKVVGRTPAAFPPNTSSHAEVYFSSANNYT